MGSLESKILQRYCSLLKEEKEKDLSMITNLHSLQFALQRTDITWNWWFIEVQQKKRKSNVEFLVPERNGEEKEV